jgi:hypothetical protein
VSPVKYELGFYIPEDDILHSHRHQSQKSYITHNFFSYKRFHFPVVPVFPYVLEGLNSSLYHLSLYRLYELYIVEWYTVKNWDDLKKLLNVTTG